jgi:hypothetical protein
MIYWNQSEHRILEFPQLNSPIGHSPQLVKNWSQEAQELGSIACLWTWEPEVRWIPMKLQKRLKNPISSATNYAAPK